MLWYAILVTFLLGGLCGACIAILTAIHMANKDAETKRRKAIHPSTRQLGDDAIALTE